MSPASPADGCDDVEQREARPRLTPRQHGSQTVVARVCGRLILIEHNPADVALFRWALRDQGVHEYLEVFDHGDVAMAFARQEGLFRNDPPPDVVVIDLELPGYSGMEILGAVRRNPFFCRTEVGIYSWLDDPRDRIRAMELGADFYLHKPSALEDLRALARTTRNLLRPALHSESK